MLRLSLYHCRKLVYSKGVAKSLHPYLRRWYVGRHENANGVSFRDVADYLRDIRSRRGGYLSYNLSLADRREGDAYLSIVLEHREHVVLSKCQRHAKRVWSHWPNREHRTLAGLLFNLCYRLDEEMDETERMTQQGMPF